MPATPAAAGAQRTPPPARVPGNLWTEIDAPALERFSPSASVAVHLSGPDPDGLCERTLQALSAQHYPSELVTVVPAPALAGQALEAAAKRHSVALAAPSSDDPARAAADAGELVLFLAAGALPQPRCLAAHARWHETVADAVTVGRSQRLDARSQSAERIAAGAASELDPDDGSATALETFLEATRSLTERRADLFRVAAQQNVAARSQLLAELGPARAGADPERWRLDLAYRLEQAGCVFVSEPEAESTHHYRQPSFLEPEPGSAPDQRTQSLIPLQGFRAPGGGRLHERPALAIALTAAAGEPAAEILETVDSLLSGRLADLRLALELSDDHPARAELEAACAADPRVHFQPPGAGAFADAPYQVRWPALALADERTLSDLCELIAAEGVGALHVTVPGEVPRNAMVEVAATGPLARARRLSAYLRAHEPADPAPEQPVDMPTLPPGGNGSAPLDTTAPAVLLGALFGERWVSGVEVSVRRRGAAEPQVTEHGPLAAATDLDHERTQHLRHQGRADTLQSRADRFAERAVRERIRAREERLRAERLEARLGELGEPPWYWRLRLARRLGRSIGSR